MPSILIVEDDTLLRNAYETVLKAEGYKTQAAADGLEGLEMAGEMSPAVILLDMMMPNLDGLEFLRAYDAKNSHPHTKIVVFSNMSVPSDVKSALELGAAKYLTKSSFTPKEIVSIIKEVLKSGD